MKVERSGLSLDRLIKALTGLNWSAAQGLLDAAGGPAQTLEAFTLAMQRVQLVFPYPGPKDSKRDAMLASIEGYFSATSKDGALPKTLGDEFQRIRVAETVYRDLVRALEASPAGNLEPRVHVAAVIRKAEMELQRLQVTMLEQAKERRGPIPIDFQLRDSFGNQLDIGSVIESYVECAGMIMKLQAHKNGWIDEGSTIVLPDLPGPDEAALDLADETVLLAQVWRRWESAEDKARVYGRTFARIDAQALPVKLPNDIHAAIVETGDLDAEWNHRIAFERFIDRSKQMRMETLVEARGWNFEGPKPLFPHGAVSAEELDGCEGLLQYLAYDFWDDQECFGGLRIVEWLRGYSALALLSEKREEADLRRTHADWRTYLHGSGLTPEKADIFIERTTFKISSRDLFDAPFIKLVDGTYRLFSIALTALTIPAVVLSSLSTLGVQVQRKGLDFEETVRQELRDAGLEVYAFKEKRGSDEYEYDAIVPWGDYLFIFECKNRAVPFGRPLQLLYFDQETENNIQQVRRLLRGLEEHPDIFDKRLPPGSAHKVRIPVLLSCFPVGTSGAVDGVYIYDYSALSRFFQSGELMQMRTSIRDGVQARGTGVRLWAGSKPAPEDLLAQLERSAQVEHVRSTLSLDQRGFPLPSHSWALSISFTRSETVALPHAWNEEPNA